jgi:large subunit ribosomal protein L35
VDNGLFPNILAETRAHWFTSDRRVFRAGGASGFTDPVDIQDRGITHHSEEVIMPKMKTRKAAAKRFKKTGNGKIKHRKAYRNHILTKKRRKRKRQLRQDGYLEGKDAEKVDKLLPYD